jgi:hypothetical protein
MKLICPLCKVDIDKHQEADFEICLRALAAKTKRKKKAK